MKTTQRTRVVLGTVILVGTVARNGTAQPAGNYYGQAVPDLAAVANTEIGKPEQNIFQMVSDAYQRHAQEFIHEQNIFQMMSDAYQRHAQEFIHEENPDLDLPANLVSPQEVTSPEDIDPEQAPSPIDLTPEQEFQLNHDGMPPESAYDNAPNDTEEAPRDLPPELPGYNHPGQEVPSEPGDENEGSGGDGSGASGASGAELDLIRAHHLLASDPSRESPNPALLSSLLAGLHKEDRPGRMPGASDDSVRMPPSSTALRQVNAEPRALLPFGLATNITSTFATRDRLLFPCSCQLDQKGD